jgi:hypothetical protein
MSESKQTVRELLDDVKRMRCLRNYENCEGEAAKILAAGVEAVLALHSEFKVYDADDPADYSEETYLYTCCRHCHTDDGEVNEWSDEGEWPCPTVLALAPEAARHLHEVAEGRADESERIITELRASLEQTIGERDKEVAEVERLTLLFDRRGETIAELRATCLSDRSHAEAVLAYCARELADEYLGSWASDITAKLDGE